MTNPAQSLPGLLVTVPLALTACGAGDSDENYVVQGLVTDHGGTRERFYRVRGAPELSSTIEGRKWAGETLPADVVEVPTITLDGLLERERVERIDFLSMDIEGGEPKALAAFDLARYRPELICIGAYRREAMYDDCFGPLGYERLEKYHKYDYVNLYYTPVEGEGGS